MQTAARDGVCHVGTELSVGRSGIYIRAARPVTEGIDLGSGIEAFQFLCRSVALADDQPCLVNNVLSIRAVFLVDASGDGGEGFLLPCHRDAFEDAIVAAADTVLLVI